MRFIVFSGVLGAFLPRYLHSLSPGDKVEFKHTERNIKKLPYPLGKAKTLSLLCAGTGITPMFQVPPLLFHGV